MDEAREVADLIRGRDPSSPTSATQTARTRSRSRSRFRIGSPKKEKNLPRTPLPNDVHSNPDFREEVRTRVEGWTSKMICGKPTVNEIPDVDDVVSLRAAPGAARPVSVMMGMLVVRNSHEDDREDSSDDEQKATSVSPLISSPRRRAATEKIRTTPGRNAFAPKDEDKVRRADVAREIAIAEENSSRDEEPQVSEIDIGVRYVALDVAQGQ